MSTEKRKPGPKPGKLRHGTLEKKRTRSRAGRPAEVLITRETAAEAALALIDLHGLNGLSLQGVARILGVAAPSLYHHFKDKDELLAQVVRSLIDEVGKEQPIWSADWESHTIALSLAFRRVCLRHPNAAPLILRFFPRKLIIPAYDRTLVSCPYSPEHHHIVLETVDKFTFGSALFAAAAKAQQIASLPDVDEVRFPHLALALSFVPDDEEAVFIESLRAVLDGLRTRYGVKSPAGAREAG